jgi:hypothetical protein
MSETANRMPSVIAAEGKELRVLDYDGIDRLESFLRDTGRVQINSVVNSSMLELHCENPSVQGYVLGWALMPDEKDGKKRRDAGGAFAKLFVDKGDVHNLCCALLGLVPRMNAEQRGRYYSGEPLHEVMAATAKEGVVASDPTTAPA